VDPAAILGRVLDQPRVAYVMAVLDTYGRAAGGLLANGLAFAALFAVIPIALVTLGLAGLLVADPAVQSALADALVQVFPPLEELISGALDALSQRAAVTSLIGVVGLIWTVSQFYVTLDVAFARIFAHQPERDVFRRTARGFLWVGTLLAAVMVLIILGALVSAGNALVPEAMPVGREVVDALTSWPVMVAMAIGLLAVVYRVVPPYPPSWRAVSLPAVVVGLAVVVLTQLFVFLAPRLVGVAALAGSLATAFVALAWLSFSFQALLYGASWIRVRVERSAEAVDSALSGPAAPAEPGGGGE
jgi:YihY family inner membrane protein